MKRTVFALILGMLIGAVALGSIAIAAELVVVPSNQGVYVDGVKATVDAYNIDGSNYFKARDFAAAMDVGMWYNEETRSIMIETDKGYDPDYKGPATQIEPKTDPTGNTSSNVVYVTPTGKKWHRLDSCAGENATPIDISEVGFRTPCETCAQ